MSDDSELDETDYSDEEDDLADECGMTNSGQCQLAGSEFCDFECPLRDTVYKKYFEVE